MPIFAECQNLLGQKIFGEVLPYLHLRGETLEKTHAQGGAEISLSLPAIEVKEKRTRVCTAGQHNFEYCLDLRL